MLCSALWRTGLAGRPDEYLGPRTRARYETVWGRDGDAEYFRRVLAFGTTPNGIFSVKVHAEHLPRVMPWRGLQPFTCPARDAVHWYWLRRHDRIRQAVSLYRAQISLQYRVRGIEPSASDPVPFDFARISACLQDSERDTRRWRRVFAALGVTPVELHYEDYLEHGFATTVVGILGSIGIQAGPESVETDFRKQADDVSEQLVQRYGRERRKRLR